MLKIGELAQQAGLNASKIRFFEKEGVFNVGQRQANGYRVYPLEAVELLTMIVQAQEVGFSLKELRAIGQAGTENGSLFSPSALLDAIEQKLQHIQQMQSKLAANEQKLNDILRALKDNPEDSECAARAHRLLAL